MTTQRLRELIREEIKHLIVKKGSIVKLNGIPIQLAIDTLIKAHSKNIPLLKGHQKFHLMTHKPAEQEPVVTDINEVDANLINQQVTSLESQKQTLQKQITALQTQIDALQGRKIPLQKRIDGIIRQQTQLRKSAGSAPTT